MATLVQTVGFPLLFIPFFLIPSLEGVPVSSAPPSPTTLALVLSGSCISLHLLIHFFVLLNWLSTQFLNFQKLTALRFNSIIVLSLSAALVVVDDDSDEPSGVLKLKYFIGFICTLSASALWRVEDFEGRNGRIRLGECILCNDFGWDSSCLAGLLVDDNYCRFYLVNKFGLNVDIQHFSGSGLLVELDFVIFKTHDMNAVIHSMQNDDIDDCQYGS
ncbi:hypothetical protein RJ641_016434 [Dillenia turbinata]|uniref:Uncharacterized protein n=1 Tax=Dillenia turbinata TaxID=194707 RepID=A0AAN8UYZ4_9MAGN